MWPGLEIACDESGFAGGSLVGGPPVFAHASVRLAAETADTIMAGLRERLGAPPGELKSGRLLRARHRAVVAELLSLDGPLTGRARVHLTETTWFVLARLADALLGSEPVAALSPGQDPRTRNVALRLHHHGPTAYGPVRWPELLTVAANLLRPRSRWLPSNPVERFAAAIEAATGNRELDGLMTELRRALPRAAAIRTDLAAHPKRTPWMEPVIPALTRAAEIWSADGQPVAIVHDEQSAVTPERVADITRTLAGRDRILTGVRLVDSRTDARVQVADLLAGAARRLASEALAGHADPELTDLLAPFVDPGSTWSPP